MRTALQICSASLRRSLNTRPATNIRHTFITRAALTPAATRTFHQSIARREAAQDDVLESFAELGTRDVLHPTIVRTLTEGMGLERMTEVQSKTITEAIKGTDIVAQARTGTGKTLAFLMPILQNIIKKDPELARPDSSRRGPRTTADDIRALIISPTRELAEQIAVEARRLVAGTSVVVQAAVGGTQKSAGLRAIQRDGCHILVGTPGRLKDILTDEYSRVQAPDLSCLVLDEADRLLDQGFWPAIQEIQSILPSLQEKDRQTLLFSATVPREVVDVVRKTLKPGFQFVQCVREGEEQTHERVPQKIVVTKGLENNLPTLVELCTREIEARQGTNRPPFKAIVYYPATAEVTLTNAALRRLDKSSPEDAMQSTSRRFAGSNHPWADTRIFEIHGKLTQAARTRAADEFRHCRSGILLSSDVTARGLDFPDVTHVIQMCVPPNQEQYIHRIGRTARAGKEGEGWLIVSEHELAEARNRVGRLPIKRDETLEVANLDLSKEQQISPQAANILGMVQKAMSKVDIGDKVKSYRALIGVLSPLGNKVSMIRSLNALSQFGWGLREPPMISPLLARKLGIDNVPGIRLGHNASDDEERGGSRASSRPRFGDSFGQSFGDRTAQGGGYAGRSEGSGSYADRSERSGGYAGRGGRSGGYAGRSEGAGGYAGRSEGSGGYGDRSGGRGGYGERSGGRGGYGERSGGRGGYGERSGGRGGYGDQSGGRGGYGDRSGGQGYGSRYTDGERGSRAPSEHF